MAQKIHLLNMEGVERVMEFPFPEYSLTGKREDVDKGVVIFVDYDGSRGWTAFILGK